MQTTVGLCGNGIVRGLKHEPVRVIQVQAKLARAGAFELVAAPREVPHVLQSGRSVEIVEAATDSLGAIVAVLSAQQAIVVALVFELLGGEGDIQTRQPGGKD